MLNRKFLRFAAALSAELILLAMGCSAQTVAYRPRNLASDLSGSGLTSHLNDALRNSWGIAFQPGGSFFIANAASGRVTVLDATGASLRPGAFFVASPAANGPGSPAGIVADPTAIFGSADPANPLTSTVIVASEDGGIFLWGVDSAGDFPQQATLMVNNSAAGAVYTSLAILSPTCCAPMLAVANFHSGRVETYDTHFAPLGSFQDPNLPPGYAPYGMQVIGNQLFVTWALQDAAKHDPVIGAGNGIVSIFDLNGRFVRRFQTGGPLNAPWGVARASANFGPFSGDIMIGNAGDGTITAFDPVTGSIMGQIKDGNGTVIANDGLHALFFEPAGAADPDALFFTAGINAGQDGIFGAFTAGLVSTTHVTVPPPSPNGAADITVSIAAAPGNSGTPTGSVDVEDGDSTISSSRLTDSQATVETVLSGRGTHVIKALYSGDANFLASETQTEVQVPGFSTTLAFSAPASASPGETVTLTATVTSPDGTPTGQIAFKDGSTSLGSVALDASGGAVLRVDTLSAGTHSLTASYSGDEKFAGSNSAPATITILAPDFSLTAAPANAAVISGQSAQILLTINPQAGFTGGVTFSCQPVAGITCTFNPVTLNVGSGSTTTTLTISAANTAVLTAFPGFGPTCLLATWFFSVFALWRGAKSKSLRPTFLTGAAALALFALAVSFVGCGGSASPAPASGRMISVSVNAQSARVSHSTSISVTVR